MLWEKVTVIGFTLLLQFGLLAVIDHDGPGLSWWIWLPGSHWAVLEVSCWETTKAARPDVSAGAPAVVCSARQSAPSSSRVWRTHDSGLSVICSAKARRRDVTRPAFPPDLSLSPVKEFVFTKFTARKLHRTEKVQRLAFWNLQVIRVKPSQVSRQCEFKCPIPTKTQNSVSLPTYVII